MLRIFYTVNPVYLTNNFDSMLKDSETPEIKSKADKKAAALSKLPKLGKTDESTTATSTAQTTPTVKQYFTETPFLPTIYKFNIIIKDLLQIKKFDTLQHLFNLLLKCKGRSYLIYDAKIFNLMESDKNSAFLSKTYLLLVQKYKLNDDFIADQIRKDRPEKSNETWKYPNLISSYESYKNANIESILRSLLYSNFTLAMAEFQKLTNKALKTTIISDKNKKSLKNLENSLANLKCEGVDNFLVAICLSGNLSLLQKVLKLDEDYLKQENLNLNRNNSGAGSQMTIHATNFSKSQGRKIQPANSKNQKTSESSRMRINILLACISSGNIKIVNFMMTKLFGNAAVFELMAASNFKIEEHHLRKFFEDQFPESIQEITVLDEIFLLTANLFRFNFEQKFKLYGGLQKVAGGTRNEPNNQKNKVANRQTVAQKIASKKFKQIDQITKNYSLNYRHVKEPYPVIVQQRWAGSDTSLTNSITILEELLNFIERHDFITENHDQIASITMLLTQYYPDVMLNSNSEILIDLMINRLSENSIEIQNMEEEVFIENLVRTLFFSADSYDNDGTGPAYCHENDWARYQLQSNQVFNLMKRNVAILKFIQSACLCGQFMAKVQENFEKLTRNSCLCISKTTDSTARKSRQPQTKNYVFSQGIATELINAYVRNYIETKGKYMTFNENIFKTFVWLVSKNSVDISDLEGKHMLEIVSIFDGFESVTFENVKFLIIDSFRHYSFKLASYLCYSKGEMEQKSQSK